jgi:hypothetical protein
MFDDVYVEGHGACTALALGALAELEAAGLLAPRRRVTCYSMASVVAVALALGAPPAGLLRLARGSELRHLGAPTLVACALLRGARERLSRQLLALIDASGVPAGMTMRELREATGQRVRVLVACPARRATYVVDDESAPGARVREALLASCAIPGVFEFDGALFDGGTLGGFRDAGLAAPAGALVIGTRCVPRPPGLHLLQAYRALLCKLQEEWREAARRAGAAVLVLRAGADGPLRVRSVDDLYACGARRARRWISAASARGASALARTYSAGSGGDEQSASSRDCGVSAAAASSSTAMSPTRRTSV